MECFLKTIETYWVGSCIIAASVIILIVILLKNRPIVRRDDQNLIKAITKLFASSIKLIDILMVVAFVLTIFLVIMTVVKQPTDGSFDLAILTISMAFGAIIPYIVGSSIAKNEVSKIVDAKFEGLEQKYAIKLFALSKQNAHTKRMSANLLLNNCDADPSNKKWAIGWASEALISYCSIWDEYNSEKYIKECIAIFDKVSPRDCEISPHDTTINERTLRSLVTMHVYTKMKHPNLHKQIFWNYARISNLEKQLFQSSLAEYNKGNIPSISKDQYIKKFCENCDISDLHFNAKEKASLRDEIKAVVEGLDNTNL